MSACTGCGRKTSDPSGWCGRCLALAWKNFRANLPPEATVFQLMDEFEDACKSIEGTGWYRERMRLRAEREAARESVPVDLGDAMTRDAERRKP